ncbi:MULTISPECIES: ribonuclease P protein component [unclassified Candidatus Tisiphia]|uniref:Ribonuclease P protein component n=1 Tax=Candidatus Tisiphia endosymbiont of Sergentomyia squamirostris TaxID=3113639 RepID=A0AAT9G6F2_9RICK|nr:ribonuclease P protein component [Rickettsiaceae bacterium]MDD9337255.1 ribonuclease P protein component [Rickettsiaceae bacterium]UCM92780.1 MAG: ribonuclease P protein component [Rickettsia endosymbiont of Cimex lectularius]
MLISSLKNQKEFDLVNKLGKKFHSPYFITIIAKNSTKLFAKLNVKGNIDNLCKKSSEILYNSSNTLLFGMKVGKKLGNAVIRNKIKRRIRHLVRLLSKESKFKQNSWAMIVIPRKGFEQIEFATLLSELYKIVSQV